MKAYVVMSDLDDEYFISEEKAQLRALELNERDAEQNEALDNAFGGDHGASVFEIEIVE